MDETTFFIVGVLLCLALVVGFALIGFLATLVWVGRQLGQSSPKATQSVGGEATLALLRRFRTAPDPLAALDQAIARLQRGESLEEGGGVQPASALLSPNTAPPPATEAAPVSPILPGMTTSPLPGTPPTSATLLPVGPALRPSVLTGTAGAPLAAPLPTAPARVRQNWLALDNITLLLYLGAALVLIAVGVFVGSTWGAIPGVVRWAIIAGMALAFLGLGEAFVRTRAVLQRAGETFRALGLVLLPFVALAFERFVLNGQAPALFWLVCAAGLALFYYALYRWTSARRLPATLASLSLGVFALVLPESVNLDAAWRGPALLGLSSALLAVAWGVARDGRALLRGFTRPGGSVLAESHLALGMLYALGSLALLGGTVAEPSWVPLIYFALLTGWFSGVAAWFGSPWPLGAAALSAGLSILGGVWLLPETLQAWGAVLGLNTVAAVLFLLAPMSERRLGGARVLLTLAAAGWSSVALAASLFSGPAPVLVAAMAATGLWGAVAWRFRRGEALWPALVGLHLAVLAALDLVSTGAGSALVPTAIWVVLAGAWLALAGRSPAWLRSFVVAAFVAEAVWTSLFGWAGMASAALAGVALTLGWLVWARQGQRAWGVAAAILQAIYAIFAVVALFRLPLEVVPALALLAGAALVLGAARLPAFVQRVGYRGGLLLILGAPLLAWIGEENRLLPVVTTIQAALLGSTVLVSAEAWRRRSDWLFTVATVLSYGAALWLTVDYLPVAAVPLVLLAVALLRLALVPRVPDIKRRWMEPLALFGAFWAGGSGFSPLTWGAVPGTFLGLSFSQSSQLALLLGALLLAVRGWQRGERWFVAVAGLQVYALYCWLAAGQGVEDLQLFSAPLALLFLGYGWLFPRQRPQWEGATVLVLLLPALAQSVAAEGLLYTLLLGGWGLVLLALGISLGRRVLLGGGVAALLVAALRQIWSLVSALPPGAIIGLVGLVFMVAAIVLTLRRDALLRLRARTGEAWEQLGRRD